MQTEQIEISNTSSECSSAAQSIISKISESGALLSRFHSYEKDVPGYRENSKLLRNIDEEQFYRFNTANKNGDAYLCADENCYSRVHIRTDDSIPQFQTYNGGVSFCGESATMVEESKSGSNLSNVKNQVLSSIIANFIILSHGCAGGWMSPALPTLLSEDTPLSTGPLTSDQLSWIASVASIGSLTGTFTCGFISLYFGCKRAMVFLAFPGIIFWLLIYFGHTYYHLLLARYITGITAGGIHAGVTIYISEIANDNLRGRLGAITSLFRNVGYLVAFFAGAIVEYQYRPLIFIPIPIIYMILILILPNTPQFYLKRDDFQNAEKALVYYKSCKGNSDREKILLSAEFERLKLVVEDQSRNPKIQLKDFRSKMALNGIVMSVAMAWFLQTTGCYIITSFASIILKQSGTVFGIHVESIILAFVQIVGNLVSTRMGDTFGRKTTLFISLFGSAAGLFTFSAYTYLRHIGCDVSRYLWLPVVCLSFIIFVSSAGIMALSSMCTAENFPSKIRTSGMVFYSLCNNIVAFVGDKSFPILLDFIYLHGFMLVLAINCCIGIILLAFMKETRGHTIDAIGTNEDKPITDIKNDQHKC